VVAYIGVAREAWGAMGPTNFLEDMAILSFERQYPKQNRVIRVKSNIFAPPKFLGWLRYW